MKLSGVIHLKSGLNQTRYDCDSEKIDWYTFDDLNYDLSENLDNVDYTVADFSKFNVSEGNLVFGMVKNKVAFVSSKNDGKVLNINFMKISLDTEKVDPWYFIYYINESREFVYQLGVQTTNKMLKKITGKQLCDCEITLPSLKRQKLIGEMYKIQLKQRSLFHKKDELTMRLIQEITNRFNNSDKK